MFSDQLLLQDVLARSDRAMAVVKDLFGDAPRRQAGIILLIDCYVVAVDGYRTSFISQDYVILSYINDELSG